MKNYYDEIFDYVNSLVIIDSHEHLPGEDVRNRNTDVLEEYLRVYWGWDLISAGMKRSQLAFVRDSSKPLTERFRVVEPYWNLARNTGYGRVLDMTAKGLYGIDRIRMDTIEELNAAFLKTLSPGQNHYHKVLKEMSNIAYSVVNANVVNTNLANTDLDCDRTYFRSAYVPLGFTRIFSWDDIEYVERLVGFPVNCLDDWEEACRLLLDQAIEKGAVALKCTLAYLRPLLFENSTKKEAEECFNQQIITRKGFNSPGAFLRPITPTKAFEDYMVHYVLRLANRRGMVCQIHTGLQGGNGNDITNSDPSLLTNLFLQYTNVKFDLFHIGYPYQHLLSALGKMFPNVYLDMCWAHTLSPAASMQALDDWLDSVPVNKITAFGGDYDIVDLVYGHQLLARMNVSKVLAKKIHDGIFSVDEAKWMAQRMFYENPKSLYGE